MVHIYHRHLHDPSIEDYQYRSDSTVHVIRRILSWTAYASYIPCLKIHCKCVTHDKYISPHDLVYICVSMLTIIDYVTLQCIICHILFRASIIGSPCSLFMLWMLTRWHYWCYLSSAFFDCNLLRQQPVLWFLLQAL